jgi:hypothetical protein
MPWRLRVLAVKPFWSFFMKPLDQKYLIQRKQDVVTVQSIEPVTERVVFLGPSDPEKARVFFDMGFIGARCRQTAFEILNDFIGSNVIAHRLEDAFEFDHVARWMGASAQIDGATIAGWMERYQSIIGRPGLRRWVPVAPISDSHHGEPL